MMKKILSAGILVIIMISTLTVFNHASAQIEEPRCAIGNEMIYGVCTPKFTEEAVEKLFDKLWNDFYHNNDKFLPYKQFKNYESKLALENIETAQEKFSFASDELGRIYGETYGGNQFDENGQSSLSQYRVDLDKVDEEIQSGFDLLVSANKIEAEWRIEKARLELEKTLQEKESLEKEVSQLHTQIEEKETQNGGCLIATATYGSELAPQVQQLRELRDNSLLTTTSGTNFMSTFNEFYYSFSPVIADYERENPIFKEMVKVAITPMITSLSILNYVEMDSEESVLGYGISLIMLNAMMYVGIPVLAVMRFRR
jgi:peptidoglycan hydrolase CwlO-like protein